MEELLKIQAETQIEILKALRDIEKKLIEINDNLDLMDSRLYNIERKSLGLP